MFMNQQPYYTYFPTQTWCTRCWNYFIIEVPSHTGGTPDKYLHPLCRTCRQRLFPDRHPGICLECDNICHFNEPTCKQHRNHAYCLNCKHCSRLDCILNLHYYYSCLESYSCTNFNLCDMKIMPRGINFSRSIIYEFHHKLVPQHVIVLAILECINSELLCIVEDCMQTSFSEYIVYCPSIPFTGLFYKRSLLIVNSRQLFELSGQLPSANRTATYFGIIPQDIVGLLDRFLIGGE